MSLRSPKRSLNRLALGEAQRELHLHPTALSINGRVGRLYCSPIQSYRSLGMRRSPSNLPSRNPRKPGPEGHDFPKERLVKQRNGWSNDR